MTFSPLHLCRIYDKSKEILAKNDKAWFFILWGIKYGPSVWRVEFQLRRETLRKYGVDASAALPGLLGGIWKDLTTRWLSFRLDDDTNTTRRSIHPWWQEVSQRACEFGPLVQIQRELSKENPAGAAWFVAHIAGCMRSYAMLKNLPNLDATLKRLDFDLREAWRYRNFEAECALRRVKRGLPDERGTDEQERD